MRRLLLAAVFVVAVAVGTGCGGSDGERSGGDTGSAASTAPTASSSAADNTKQVCADAKVLSEEFKQKISAILARALQDVAAGDEAKSEKTLEEMVPLAQEYKVKYEALGAKATDPRLKDALTVVAKDMASVTAEDSGDAASAAEEALTAICGA